MTTTAINLRENKHEVTVAPPRKGGMQVFVVIVCLITLAVLVGICLKQNTSDQSLTTLSTELNSLKKENNAQAASYLEENNQLKQELILAQQNADGLKSFESNVTAQLAGISNNQAQATVKETEKLVYVNNQWREFASPADLMAWANEHLVNLWIVGDKVADCDDYAARLQLEAYKDGYFISVQLINDGMLDGKNVSNYTECHMGNLAMVGNEIYFIEPQPKYFRIVFVCNRD